MPPYSLTRNGIQKLNDPKARLIALPDCLLHAPYSHFVCTVHCYRALKDSIIRAQLDISVCVEAHAQNRVVDLHYFCQICFN